MPPRLVVVGVPGEKRTAALLEAARRRGCEARCVPWSEALSSPSSVAADARVGDVLRVESPGADSSTWHALAKLGGDERRFEDGAWRPGSSWFRGLTRFLSALDIHVSDLRSTHPSEHILAMTDKTVCHGRLMSAGVPVPEALSTPRNADELRAIMDAAHRSAVYVKPRWGSSGAGVMAFRRVGDRELLITTAALANGELHNRKRLRRYEDRASIDAVLNAVLRDGSHVQRWVPKAGHVHGPLDMRVLVLRGRVVQAVGRVGRGTITNLHLDARRVSVEEALAPFGREKLSEVSAICQRAAVCFQGHHSVGVDVMLDTRGNVFVLECNAWGDYLPNLLIDGMDSYDLYLRDVFGSARDAEGPP